MPTTRRSRYDDSETVRLQYLIDRYLLSVTVSRYCRDGDVDDAATAHRWRASTH